MKCIENKSGDKKSRLTVLIKLCLYIICKTDSVVE